VELLPLWLAPNMVTLLGFLFILGNVALLELYVPDLAGPVGVLKTTVLQPLIRLGTILGLPQLRFRIMDVFDNGQRRW